MGSASHEGRQGVSGETLEKYESPALFIRFGTKSAPLRENDSRVSRVSVREIGLQVNVTSGQQESNGLSTQKHVSKLVVRRT